jgi:hypothetical protein
MKSQFLTRMSHDIRTPLNGVVGFAGLLQTTALTDEQKEFVSTIESSSVFLLTLLQDILDHSEIEAGNIELRPKPSNLYKVFRLRAYCAFCYDFSIQFPHAHLLLNTYHFSYLTSVSFFSFFFFFLYQISQN